MNTANYAALPWPWVGLLLCFALVGQEYVRQAAGPVAPLTVYNIVIMAAGVTSLALMVLPVVESPTCLVLPFARD